MKYTKKFMVVPFEEETETEILNRKEKEQDKKLSFGKDTHKQKR